MYILFDIGGTKTRLATSTDLINFTEPIIFATPDKFSSGRELLVKEIKDLLGGKKLKALAGGIAGVVDKAGGQILSAPNLPDWVGSSLVEDLKQELAVSVYLDNDTAMAGLGEAVRGAGQEGSIVAYITVSTGVGGSRIVNKKIDTTVFGFEPGHQIIDQAAFGSSAAGHSGHLDDFVSGRAVADRFACPPYEIKDDKIWTEITRQFSIGLYNTILHWSPDTVVLGGSMFKQPGIKVEQIQSDLSEMMQAFPKLPLIKLATLADFGGLYGAMVFLQEK